MNERAKGPGWLARRLGLLLLAAAAGCGTRKIDLRTASVKGKVTFRGAAAPFVALSFIDGSSNSYGATADAEGRYEIVSLIPGPLKIAAETFPSPAPGSPQPP